MSEQPSVQPQPQAKPTIAQGNVTQQLADAQKALLKYDKESVETTRGLYQTYLRMINDSQKDQELKTEDGKTAQQLRNEWEQACKARTEGRQSLERRIQEIINPALAEQDDERIKRLMAIQEMSEAACLEKSNPKLAKYKKPDLEMAIDQIGGTATQPFKESTKF